MNRINQNQDDQYIDMNPECEDELPALLEAQISSLLEKYEGQEELVHAALIACMQQQDICYLLARICTKFGLDVEELNKCIDMKNSGSANAMIIHLAQCAMSGERIKYSDGLSKVNYMATYAMSKELDKLAEEHRHDHESN